MLAHESGTGNIELAAMGPMSVDGEPKTHSSKGGQNSGFVQTDVLSKKALSNEWT